MMKYKLVYGSTQEVERKVNSLIEEGWDLFGQPTVVMDPGTAYSELSGTIRWKSQPHPLVLQCMVFIGN